MMMIYYVGNESEWITNDTIYCDTDSLYFKNPEKHAHLFDIWNKYAAERVARRLPPEYMSSLGTLGKFDNIAMDDTNNYSDTFINFKTLGSKRYIKEMQFPKCKKVKTTVAGLPKGCIEKFCKRTGADIYLTFDNLFDFTVYSEDIAEQEKVKLGRKYHDEKMVFFIAGEKVVEYSSCTLYPTTFKIKMSDMYLAYIDDVQNTIQGDSKSPLNFLLIFICHLRLLEMKSVFLDETASNGA